MLEEEEENIDTEINNKNEEQEDDFDDNEEDEEILIKKIEKLDEYQLPYKYIFRLCLLGDPGVGKTSLITRFCDGSFKENYNNTIGVDFRLASLKYKKIITKVHIWDTAGQERFRSLALNYINNSHGFAFVYDITDKKSYENITNWISIALDKNKNSKFNFLIGNKSDKENERQISQNEAEKLAKSKNLIFLETSAKNDENVKKLFYYFTIKLIKYYKNNNYEEEDSIHLTSSKTEELATTRPSQSKCSC